MGDTFGIGKVMETMKQCTTDALLEIKPDELTEQAEQRLATIKAFRNEIHECFAPILDQVEAIKAKFTGKVYSEGGDQQQQSSEGILTGAFVDYIECISSLETEKLDNMLKADVAVWKNNLEQTQSHAEQIKEQIKAQIEELMREQEEKLQEILRPNRYVHKRPSNPFRLVKQNLFGSPVHLKRIQFEWPTDKIFDLVPDKDSLCIESLTFKANEFKQFISVQCKLSNGMNSPVYKSLMSDTP